MSKTIFAFVAAATIGSASVAVADPTNYFGLSGPVKASSVLDVALVTTTGAGSVTIYDYHAGTQGAALGMIPVNAGANADLHINLGVPPQSDVIAVLTIDGQVAATHVYDVTSR